MTLAKCQLSGFPSSDMSQRKLTKYQDKGVDTAPESFRCQSKESCPLSHFLGRYESESCVYDCYHQIMEDQISYLVRWRSELSLKAVSISILEFLLQTIVRGRLEGEALPESC